MSTFFIGIIAFFVSVPTQITPKKRLNNLQVKPECNLARSYTASYTERLELLGPATDLTLVEPSKSDAHFPIRLKILDYLLRRSFLGETSPSRAS